MDFIPTLFDTFRIGLFAAGLTLAMYAGRISKDDDDRWLPSLREFSLVAASMLCFVSWGAISAAQSERTRIIVCTWDVNAARPLKCPDASNSPKDQITFMRAAD